jgi:hypothetical protein
MQQGVYIARNVVEIKPVVTVGFGVLTTMSMQDHSKDTH